MSEATVLRGRARLLHLVVAVIGRLPLAVLRGIGSAIGWLGYRLNVREARVARRNFRALGHAVGPAEKLTRSTMLETGRGLAELPWVWTRPAQHVLASMRVVEGAELIERVRADAVLIAAPHLGSFEALNRWLAAHFALMVLYRPPKQAGIEALLCAMRSADGAVPLRAEPSAVRRLLKQLAAGGAVGILPDQQPKAGEGEFASFFGIPALTMTLFPKLAMRSGVRVLIAYALRRAGGFDVYLRAADPVIVDAVTLNANIERCAALAPTQYQWTYKRYSMRPEPDAVKFYD